MATALIMTQPEDDGGSEAEHDLDAATVPALVVSDRLVA